MIELTPSGSEFLSLLLVIAEMIQLGVIKLDAAGLCLFFEMKNVTSMLLRSVHVSQKV